MSLINKMLQDLEERKSGVDALGNWQGQVRAAPEPRSRGVNWPLLLCLSAGLAAGIGGGAWWLNSGQEEISAASPAQAIAHAPALSLRLDHVPPSLPNPAEGAFIAATPAEPAEIPAQTNAIQTADTNKAATSLADTNSSATAALPANAAPSRQAKPQGNKSSDGGASASETVSPEKSGADSRRTQAAPHASGATAKAALTANEKPRLAESFDHADEEGAIPVKVSKQVKELTPGQRAENEYRRALVLVEQGKSKEAASTLEQALQIDSRHAAARQTLAALLIDGKRPDEAVRLLSEGLNNDRAQVGLAMMLARLQVDRQEVRAAIETLRLSLPYANERSDYRAFMAALLQREARHKEAVDHYLAALRKSPNNGLWWMGIGISLQAENRIPEARDAFGRAKMSGNLSPDLLAFVEQKLAQLR